MMRAFRNSVKYAAPIFAVLMLIFVLTSVDWSTLLSGGRAAGKINGEKVDGRVYETAVQQQIEAQQRGQVLTLEDVNQIRNEVWEQFVQGTVLNAEYRRRGLTASPEEIAEAIKTFPPQQFQNEAEFQTDGKFDLAKYHRWLQSSVAQPYIPALEAQYREDILRNKLLRSVASDIFFSDAALWQKYRDEHEAVKIRLVAIVPRAVVPDSTVTVTPEEATSYYNTHRDEFKRSKTAFLSYVVLPRLPNASDTAAALERAKAVRQEIVGGAPFAEVARRQSSDTASANRGGELEEWKRGSFDPAFDAWAFNNPVNAISPPVLSAFGYHLIQVSSRQGDKAKGRHILIPIEVTGEHRDRLDAQADSLEVLAADKLDPASLDTVARALNLPIGRTNPVQEGTRVQIGQLVVGDAGVWAFQAKQGEISPIIETSYAFYLFRLDSLQAEGVPPLEQIRDAATLAARDAKKWEAARKIAEGLKQRMAEGSSLTQAADALKLPSRELGPFTRVSPPLPNPQLVGMAFGTEEDKRSEVVETEEGIYALQVLDRTKADSAAFAKNLDQLRVEAVRLARQERARSYLTALREAAKVEDRRTVTTAAQAEARAAQPPPVGS